MFKKKILIFVGIIFLLIIESCSSSDLYRLNYPDDPNMQKRMEKDFGDVPFWNEN